MVEMVVSSRGQQTKIVMRIEIAIVGSLGAGSFPVVVVMSRAFVSETAQGHHRLHRAGVQSRGKGGEK